MNDLRSAGRGNSLSARDIASVVHPYTNLKAHEKDGPLVIARGKGIYIYDDSGKEYIEGLAGLWCTSLGFSEERLVEAATRQLRQLPTYHVFAAKSHEPAIELAERLLAMAPSPMARVFFANSGSEANDTAIKLVWYYNNALNRPQKKKIISRQRAYHGVTIASASLTGLPNNHRDFDLPIANIIHTDCPHAYNFANPGESEEAFTTRMAESLEALILREGPDTIAAFIAEPVMGAGGVLVPPKGYFTKIQAILKKYDILFICDEVICGFGRTGSMWGAQTFGIQPDMLVMAKALSSAYLPISAVLVNESIWKAMVAESEKIGTFGHGYTYSAHPVAAAVAIETLKIYEERDILSHVRSVAPRFQAGFQKLATHPLVGEAQSVGLIGAVQLMQSRQPKRAFEPKQMVGAYMAKRAEAHGLICRALLGDRVALCPPLIATADQIDEVFRRFTLALEDTAAMVRDKGLAAA
ncbi:MAG TPA: aspartate aminotransferase family protein [Alphaproteobacteria bacterium]|nr:aspartate aminotransferase family protein [Alphaproteobacteria bacterium]